jgi:hypothetical protein
MNDQQQREIEIATGEAFWFHYGLPGVNIGYVLIPDVLGQFEPQALLSTQPDLCPAHILSFFMARWQMEPTFQLVRTHLGVETQRQWADQAIARTPPVLMGLFSFVTVLAHDLIARFGIPVRSTRWYSKTLPTFSDALALVQTPLWTHLTFHTSHPEHDMVKVPRALFDRFADLLAYAA